MLVDSRSKSYQPGKMLLWRQGDQSYTSLSKFLECPVIYWKHYKDKQRETITPALIFGRAWHGMCEDALVEKLWKNRNMTQAEILDRWHQRWLLELFLAREEFSWKGEQSPEDYFKAGEIVATMWHRDYLPALKPASVEEEFRIELTGVTRALYGRLDLTTRDGMVVDHKTSSRSWAWLQEKGYAEKGLDLQMAIYHGAYQQKYKTWPTSVELHRVVLDTDPYLERIDVTYTVDEVQKVFNETIKPTIARIETAWKTEVWDCTCGNHKTVKGKPTPAKEKDQSVDHRPVLDITLPEPIVTPEVSEPPF